jgi:hypothetical protein
MPRTVPPTEGQHILDELLGEIALSVTHYGTVEDNPHLRIADVHGTGYLTGASAAILDCLADQQTSSKREEDLMTVATFALLAVIAGRQRDAALLLLNPPPLPPLIGYAQSEPETEFNELVERLLTNRPMAYPQLAAVNFR